MDDLHDQELRAAHHQALVEGTRYVGLLAGALERYAAAVRETPDPLPDVFELPGAPFPCGCYCHYTEAPCHKCEALDITPPAHWFHAEGGTP